MPEVNRPLLTTLVGSYPQPDWLVDRELLGSRPPPRVRAREVWRVADPHLEQAQDDATVLALRDMERAGIDVVTDGEIRRESYSNRFANALAGMDVENPAVVPGRTGRPTHVPRVTGPVRRRAPVLVRDVRFAKAKTERPLRVTVPGPFTMVQQCKDEHYGDERALALDLAGGVNAALRDLKAGGADPGRSGRGDTRWRRSIGRWRTWRGRPRCTPASATHTWCGSVPTATRFSTSWPTVRRSRSRSSWRSSGWTARSSHGWAARR